MILDYPWYYTLLCLLLGVAYAWILYRRTHLPRGWRAVASVLRCAAVSAVAFMLLSPVVRHTATERQKPVVVVAEDVSLSVRLGADSAFSADALCRAIEPVAEVVRIPFGTDGFTDISAALSMPVLSTPQACVLATDGIYNRGLNPVAVAERLACPVHTIALGDTMPRRDASVGALRCNRIALLGNRFEAELTVTAHLLEGERAELSVSAGGTRVATEALAYDGPRFVRTVVFTLDASEPGLQRFDVLLSPVEGELMEENNRLTFYVDVIDTRRRVAIVAAAPHPDLGAIKAAVGSNPNYEARLFLASDAKALDSLRREADDYSLLILHNLPSATADVRPDALAPSLPVLYVVGLQTDLGRFNAMRTGLEIVSRARKTNEVTAQGNAAFALFQPADGDLRAAELFPPLDAPFGEARVAEGVQSLFTARLGNIDTRLPLMAAGTVAEKRVAFVWGEGLWKWRLADYEASGSHAHFDRLFMQLATFTALAADRNRLQVDAERSYAAGVPIVIGAQYYNESYQPVNTPEAVFTLDSGRVATGKGTDFTVSRRGQGYAVHLGALPEGLYHYTARAADAVAEGSFAVEALQLEQQRLVADHPLLRAVSQATGGGFYTSAQVDELVERLSQLKPVIYTRRTYADVGSLPLALALIVLLLAAEWIIRKYHGSV